MCIDTYMLRHLFAFQTEGSFCYSQQSDIFYKGALRASLMYTPGKLLFGCPMCCGFKYPVRKRTSGMSHNWNVPRRSWLPTHEMIIIGFHVHVANTLQEETQGIWALMTSTMHNWEHHAQPKNHALVTQKEKHRFWYSQEVLGFTLVFNLSSSLVGHSLEMEIRYFPLG